MAVAVCRPGRSAPALETPPTGRTWTRSAVRDWIVARIVAGGRPLIGIDCAFSLPFDRAGGYFRRPATAPDLWALVDAVCADDPDLSGSPFVRHPAFAGGFWTAGPRDPAFVLAQRETERACREDGLGTPESPYKLIGAKQVGKGALAGMRLLHAVRAALGDRVAVWPFDPPRPGLAVVAEIYPRLFLRMAGAGNRKVRSWAGLAEVLFALGSDPCPIGSADPSDHETDALVTAAGLRAIAADPRIWNPPGLTGRARRQEGWILGVGVR